MDLPPVYCPYCGSEMTSKVYPLFAEKDNLWCGYYWCVDCMSESPYVEGVEGTREDGERAAYEAAATRSYQYIPHITHEGF